MNLLSDVFVRIKLLLLQAERSSAFVNTRLLNTDFECGDENEAFKNVRTKLYKTWKTKKKYKKKNSIQIPNICTDLLNVVRRVS